MRLSEIGIALLEMTFDRKIVEQKFRGREETMTEHLVKLLAFAAGEQTRVVWKKELRNHLIYLSGLRMRNKKPAPAITIWKWLYLDPIEGNETGVVQGYIMMHQDDYERNAATPQEIAERIREFYSVVSRNLAAGDPSSDTVASL
jgi:hypothetical protein